MKYPVLVAGHAAGDVPSDHDGGAVRVVVADGLLVVHTVALSAAHSQVKLLHVPVPNCTLLLSVNIESSPLRELSTAPLVHVVCVTHSASPVHGAQSRLRFSEC